MTQRLQRDVLAGGLDPVQGRAADAEAPRHLDLGEPGVLPKAVKRLGESASSLCEGSTAP